MVHTTDGLTVASACRPTGWVAVMFVQCKDMLGVNE